MRALILSLLCAWLLPPAALQAQSDLPATMPPRAAPSEIPRNLGIGLAAWEQLQGYKQASRDDAFVVRDFEPIPLADGSIVIQGLGVRLLQTKELNRDVLQIVDMREYGAFWASRGDPPFGIGDIGSFINGDAFALNQQLRTALSKSASKKLQQGFSIQIGPLERYLNTKNEPRLHVHQRMLRIDPLVRPLGRWIVAEPEAEGSGMSPQDEYDQMVSEFREMVKKDPCGMTGAKMMDYERQTELLEVAAGEYLPDVNFRHEQAAACAISKHGPYHLSDLQRLAALREADCSDVATGLSPRIQEIARDLQTKVAPPEGYLEFAQIGLYDIRDPSRKRLSGEDGAARKACLLTFLEDDLFTAP